MIRIKRKLITIYNEPKKINIEKGKAYMAGDYVNGYKFPFNPEILYRIKQPALCAPTYTWSGLYENGIFKATNNTSAISISPGTTAQIVFNIPLFNPNGRYYTNGNYWNVETSGSYTVTSKVLNTALYKLQIRVNGVVVSQADGNITFGSRYSIITANLNLNAGDLVTIWGDAGGGSGGSSVTGTYFTADINNASADINNINHLYKKLPVFKVGFIYDDYEASVWSPISKYVFPQTLGGGGSGEEILSQDNLITIAVPTGSSIVTKINVAVKFLGSSDFSLVAVLDKAELLIGDDTLYFYQFRADVTGFPLEVNQSNQLFSWVPQVSQSQEIIKGPRLADGLVTENFDPVDIDMRLKINSTPVLVETSPSGNSFFPYKSYFKSGSQEEFGIVYKDHGGRLGLSNIIKGDSRVLLPSGKYGTTLRVPFLTESDYPAPHDNPNTDMSYVPEVTTEIYNVPPDWATHYEIVRTKNQVMGRYFQFIAQDIDYTDDNGSSATPANATQLRIDITNIMPTGRYAKENPGSLLTYDYVGGDRIRFIAGRSLTDPQNEIQPFFSYNDTPIASFNTTSNLVVILLTPNVNDVLRTMGRGVLYEIYNPTNVVVDNREILYEIGECYEIITLPNGEKVHQGKGGQQDQSYYTFFDNYNDTTTGFIGVGASGFSVGDKIKIQQNPGFQFAQYNTYATVTAVTNAGANEIITTDIPWAGNSAINGGIITKAATITLSGGDCFRRFCNMPRENSSVVTRLYSYIESMNASDLFVSNAYDFGRPNVIDDNIKRITRKSTIRYSESFIPETFINGLSNVFDNNFETYDLTYGGIYKLFYDNQRLIMFQELKIGAILVEQTTFNDFTDQNVVGASTVVLNPQVIYYQPLLGIGKNPESFAYYNGAMYGIDVNRSVCWRLSNNGLTAISSIYKMANYFNHKCADILTSSSKVNIYGVYDVYFGEYIVSFGQFENSSAVVVPGETLAFNELENMWTTFYSYKPEMMCSDGINILSFKNGKLYKHNSGYLYANFYGVQYKPGLWFYCNVAPSNVKVFEAISLEADDAWNVVIETPITQQNTQGQHTELIQANFQLKEGVWYSDILKDDYTPNVVFGGPYLPNARFRGNPMRGKYALVKLEYPGIDYTKIFAVNVLVIGSERSNK